MSLQSRLKISPTRLDDINDILLNPGTEVVTEFLKVVEKYGTPEEINAKAAESGKLENLLARVKSTAPEHLADLEWLQEKTEPGCLYLG